MKLVFHGALIPVCCLALSACGSIPRTVEEGRVEIAEVKRAIECDLAAIAMAANSDFTKTWGAKSSLDLTLTMAAGVDGKLNWVIPHAPTPMFNVDPTMGISGQNKSIAHLDFSTDITAAIANFEKNGCVIGPDPSGVGLGLASWLASTIHAVGEKGHRGMSYTTEFVLEAKAGTRFGYKITRFGVDAGPSLSRAYANRVTVAVAPPPKEPEPIEVVIVQDQTKAKLKSLQNLNLDRLLQRQAPLNIPIDQLR